MPRLIWYIQMLTGWSGCFLLVFFSFIVISIGAVRLSSYPWHMDFNPVNSGLQITNYNNPIATYHVPVAITLTILSLGR